MDCSGNGSSKNTDAQDNGSEFEGWSIPKSLERQRLNLNIDRQRSYDERSLSELAIGISPHHFSKNAENSHRPLDHLDNALSPRQRSGIATPRSLTVDPHSILYEGWEALKRSLVYFRGQPVGTIAALDNSEENLNYDQVPGSSCLINVSDFSFGERGWVCII